MKTIPVRFSAEVMGEMLVDDEDYETLAQHRWAMTGGYPIARINGKGLAAHRLLLGLAPGDGVHVDHLNHRTLDNRRANLQPGTQAENNRNRLDRSGRTVTLPDGVAHLHAQAPPVRLAACAGCGAPLTPKRRKWCSDGCRGRTAGHLLRHLPMEQAA